VSFAGLLNCSTRPFHCTHPSSPTLRLSRGRSRENSLAAALAIAESQDRWHWACVDIEKAFDRIRRSRLGPVLKRLFPEDVIDMVFRLIGMKGTGHPRRDWENLTPLKPRSRDAIARQT